MVHRRNSISTNRGNILFVIGSLEIGGAERQMCTLIEQLQARSFSCHVFKLIRNGYLVPDLRNLSVPIYDADLDSGDIAKRPWKLILAELKLLKTIIYVKPIVVHSFLPLLTFMGSLAGRLARVPLVIISQRSLIKYQERHPILRPLDYIAHRLSHLVTVNSQAVWSEAVNGRRLSPGKVVLIHNGVNPLPFVAASGKSIEVRDELGINHQAKVIITVANLIPYKGHADLLEALSEVMNQVPEAICLFVGEDRGIQKELERQARTLGVRDRVIFMGLRNDIPNLMAASDVSVLPSYEEGFSNVILESMAAGLSVVTTRVGGNPDVVVDGVTGWLVPSQSPKELAIKIVDLLNNPKKARKWGEMGRQRVTEIFPIEKMVGGYSSLYQRALSKK
jgi:glycosyltransferase involved in cell wall biosynthesis